MRRCSAACAAETPRAEEARGRFARLAWRVRARVAPTEYMHLYKHTRRALVGGAPTRGRGGGAGANARR